MIVSFNACKKAVNQSQSAEAESSIVETVETDDITAEPVEERSKTSKFFYMLTVIVACVAVIAMTIAIVSKVPAIPRYNAPREAFQTWDALRKKRIHMRDYSLKVLTIAAITALICLVIAIIS